MSFSDTQKRNLAIEPTGAPSKPLYAVFAASAILGISGWIFLLSLYIFWMLEPTKLATIEEPIPVLNANNSVAVGENLRLKFVIDKPEDIAPDSAARYFECVSGNLVTFTASAVNLPVGKYVINSNDVVIPAKITPGDSCVFVIQVTYEINPLKQVTERFKSEQFTVVKSDV